MYYFVLIILRTWPAQIEKAETQASAVLRTCVTKVLNPRSKISNDTAVRISALSKSLYFVPGYGYQLSNG